MGWQENLTEENVEELREHLEKMKKDNPELKYDFYEMNKKPKDQDEQPSNKAIFEKLETLERKLEMIFGTHVLINGKWELLKPLSK